MNSILARNIKNLEKSLNETINAVDLDYRCNRYEDEENKIGLIDPIISGASPMLNEYKLWLQSSKSDYIRDYGYGGFFNNNLNEYPFSPDSEERIQEDLVAKTKELFPDINILSCEVKCMAPKTFWRVKVVVGDKTTGMIATDMVANGESIVYNVNSVSKQ